ncbi:MAG: class I SAM-dependent methyltransferase [Candidatus Accumulibacter sp.]|jgi:SAM-dependent methyltransferase|nr:class I SAM-dependent methyltransferase [Accumulibacter sp.]
MNPAWSDGYHAGRAYPALFHRELTPVWLATVATALGHRAPDLSASYTWCELGCGPGLTTLIAAAANPGGSFYAVDFDAAAIARARALAEEAGLGNAHFLHMSFADLAGAGGETLPPLDFLVSHGVLSWISPENRRAVWRIVERWLKPGGLACFAYMSQPGSAPLMAMQRVLRRLAETAQDAQTALSGGLGLLRALRDGGAGQFVVSPDLGAQLEQLAKEPPDYLAHEFLGEYWEPLHAADVIAALAQTGAGFLGSATPLENIDAVSIPARAQPAIAALMDVPLRETAKDIARNQSLRRDLYQRGAHALSVAEHRAALETLRFAALPGAPKAGALRFDTRIGPVDGPAEMFSPLLSALSDGRPKTFRELMALPAYAGNGGIVNQACQMLMWAGILHPCPPRAPADAAAAQALNRVLERELADCIWSAEALTGSGIFQDRLSALPTRQGG